jgi:hypothetical protein
MSAQVNVVAPQSVAQALASASVVKPKVARTSQLRIATAEIVAGKRTPIKGIETLLGIKSARMATASEVRNLIGKMSTACDSMEVAVTGQRLAGLLDIFGSNTQDDVKGAFALVRDAYAKVENKAASSEYQRNSEYSTIFQCYMKIGRDGIERVTKDMGFDRALNAVRAESKRIAAVRAEHALKLELMAQEIVVIPGATEEQQAERDAAGMARVSEKLREAHDKATLAALEADAESKTPQGIAKATAKSLVSRFDGATALEVCGLLRDAIKVVIAQERAKADKLAAKKVGK